MDHYDPLDTVTNEEREAKAQADKDRAEAQRIEDLKWFMSDKRGRRIMWNLLALTGIYRNPYQTKREDTDFLCGVLSVGQTYFGEVMIHAPERYTQMQQENSSNDRTK